MTQIEFEVDVVDDVVRFWVKVRDKLSRFVMFGFVLLKDGFLIVGGHVGGDGEVFRCQRKVAMLIMQVVLIRQPNPLPRSCQTVHQHTLPE